MHEFFVFSMHSDCGWVIKEGIRTREKRKRGKEKEKKKRKKMNEWMNEKYKPKGF